MSGYSVSLIMREMHINATMISLHTYQDGQSQKDEVTHAGEDVEKREALHTHTLLVLLYINTALQK